MTYDTPLLYPCLAILLSSVGQTGPTLSGPQDASLLLFTIWKCTTCNRSLNVLFFFPFTSVSIPFSAIWPFSTFHGPLLTKEKSQKQGSGYYSWKGGLALAAADTQRLIFDDARGAWWRCARSSFLLLNLMGWRHAMK
jgi:hypothetical protein